ncbi:DUF3006 family protein [Indiicoccus explosivorum]|uniref:DUF3006 family protein n=1 Tax=Indiicoccus explosivorum TaxID=1917864 RepID=UPI000B430560|nr:DUF3006 family protein [Indiicoccus explosivorum]
MKSGKYTVDSIQDGIVKLLYRPDESIEEIIPIEEFPFEVPEGLIIEVRVKDGEAFLEPLYYETMKVEQRMKAKMDELKKRK